VHVLQCPFDHGGRAVAIVQTNLLEESESFGDAADKVVGGCDFDVVQGDCIEVVGSR
jgi:hypothetical protein